MLADDEGAVDQLLAKEPGNIAALIRKAEIRAGTGDDKVATAFYQTALKVASRRCPPALSNDLARAQAACQQAAKRFEDYLEDALTRAGFGFAQRPPRFPASMDILLGRRNPTLQLQQPRPYYYPGLPQSAITSATNFRGRKSWSSMLAQFARRPWRSRRIAVRSSHTSTTILRAHRATRA